MTQAAAYQVSIVTLLPKIKYWNILNIFSRCHNFSLTFSQMCRTTQTRIKKFIKYAYNTMNISNVWNIYFALAYNNISLAEY
jgi:hypothetical protein